MPIDGIIDGLKEAVERHPTDTLLAGFAKEAIRALQEVDEALDEAYDEGKHQQLLECFELVVTTAMEV